MLHSGVILGFGMCTGPSSAGSFCPVVLGPGCSDLNCLACSVCYSLAFVGVEILLHGISASVFFGGGRAQCMHPNKLQARVLDA